MANILVVTGSVRPNSVNSKIVPLVVSALEARGDVATVANLGELNLPFIDTPILPADENFTPPHENVQRWTNMIASADGVVLVTPEYNHTLSPIQLNAIDWVGKDWAGKPVVFIGYGWTSGGGQAHATAREALAEVLKANVGEVQANLFFAKDIAPDGSVIDKERVDEKINAALQTLS